MDLNIEKFSLVQIQDIKSWLDRFGVDMSLYKKVELSTIDVCVRRWVVSMVRHSWLIMHRWRALFMQELVMDNL